MISCASLSDIFKMNETRHRACLHKSTIVLLSNTIIVLLNFNHITKNIRNPCNVPIFSASVPSNQPIVGVLSTITFSFSFDNPQSLAFPYAAGNSKPLTLLKRKAAKDVHCLEYRRHLSISWLHFFYNNRDNHLLVPVSHCLPDWHEQLPPNKKKHLLTVMGSCPHCRSLKKSSFFLLYVIHSPSNRSIFEVDLIYIIRKKKKKVRGLPTFNLSIK